MTQTDTDIKNFRLYEETVQCGGYASAYHTIHTSNGVVENYDDYDDFEEEGGDLGLVQFSNLIPREDEVLAHYIQEIEEAFPRHKVDILKTNFDREETADHISVEIEFNADRTFTNNPLYFYPDYEDAEIEETVHGNWTWHLQAEEDLIKILTTD